jgi:hypothetical protein
MSRVAAVGTDGRTLLTSAAAAAVRTVIYGPFGLPAAAAAWSMVSEVAAAALLSMVSGGRGLNSIYCGRCLTDPWHGAMTSIGGWGALSSCRSGSCTLATV